ncbi:MAG: CCA tRNA nucleotidyltransferase [Planctomycetota bacterium]|nr:CCA tRNA nucleotidyltransferase [Planctomycetota bacterium]MDA0920046.1 CCA tRNA nucleotidyltransferase [Planctomycetota bacterium]
MTISQREFAEQVVRQLTDAGFTALWAGGCVRDLLVGREPKDYDVATNARPEQVRDVFGKRRTLSVGESFGVIVVLGPKSAGQVEVATFRTDGCYIDGRRPESVVFSSPEEDAQRRDFTINGMFYDPLKKQVLDFVGGEKDLAAGVLRAIGDPHARMEEDKLRMLRAVRFAATFEFDLDEATADAVRSMADQISVVSAERIAQELRRMLVDRHRARAIELCHEVGLLVRVLPELKSVTQDSSRWRRLTSRLRLLVEPNVALAFAVLLEAAGDCASEGACAVSKLADQAGRRLKLSNQEINDAGWLLKHRRSLDNASTLPLSTLKRVLSQRLATDLIALIRVRDLSNDRHPNDAIFCDDYLRMTPKAILDPPPLISGDDLIKAGFRPGPQFKEVLDRVRDAQLDLRITTPTEAMNLAAELADGI